MSGVGQDPTWGSKGSNYHFQLSLLKIIGQNQDTLQLILAALGGGGGGRELRTITYQAIANGAGYSINDVISRTDIIDVSTSTIVATVWFNETTGLSISSPPQADLTVYTPAGVVTVTNPFNLEATQLSFKALFNPVVRTPAFGRSNAVGAILAGSRSTSVYNAGTVAGTFMTVILKPGESITFDAGGQGDTLPLMAYDASPVGCEFVFTSIY